MDNPLFQALFDIQNLTRLHTSVDFTQTIHLHVKNNQLELPISTNLTLSPDSIVTEGFLEDVDHLIQVYETTIFAVIVETADETLARRLYDVDDEKEYIGEDDHSGTHYVLTVNLSNNEIKKKSLLPISRHSIPNYSPSTIVKQLQQAIEHFNNLIVQL